jgi:hypothetical protein
MEIAFAVYLCVSALSTAYAIWICEAPVHKTLSVMFREGKWLINTQSISDKATHYGISERDMRIIRNNLYICAASLPVAALMMAVV